jgi:hypothetical protein
MEKLFSECMFAQYRFKYLSTSPTILTPLRLTTTTTTMSATLNEDMSSQEEGDSPKSLESYAALVKQLVPIDNMILHDFH